jgi:hypothetical protein
MFNCLSTVLQAALPAPSAVGGGGGIKVTCTFVLHTECVV